MQLVISTRLRKFLRVTRTTEAGRVFAGLDIHLAINPTLQVNTYGDRTLEPHRCVARIAPVGAL